MSLLEIYLAFQQWKNFENPLRINKVIAMSLVYYFFGDPVYIKYMGFSIKQFVCHIGCHWVI